MVGIADAAGNRGQIQSGAWGYPASGECADAGAVHGRRAGSKLTSVYFDTNDRRLRENGLSLRVRHAGTKRLQTIKVDGPRSHLVSRGEWEHEIEGDKPDLGHVKKTPLAPLAGKKLASKLRPVFETRVTRTTVPIRVADAMVELAIDRGQMVSGKRSSPISEIEIELKDGDPKALVAVAKKLAKALPTAAWTAEQSRAGLCLSGGCGANAFMRGGNCPRR